MPRKKADPKSIETHTLEGMSVRRLGRGLYQCSSESGQKPYTIDILANGGLGECDCWDWISRRHPRWKGVKKPFDIFRCKHIRRVRNWVLDGILQTYIQQETEKPRR